MPRSAAPRRTANLTHSAVSVPVVFDLVSGRRTGAVRERMLSEKFRSGHADRREASPSRPLAPPLCHLSSVSRPARSHSSGRVGTLSRDARMRACMFCELACLRARESASPRGGGYPPGGLRRHSRLVRTWRCVARLKLNPKPYPSVPDSYH